MSIYHHVNFYRAAWNSHEATKHLRAIPELIPPLEKAAELACHKAVAIVPVPSPQSAFFIARNYEPVKGNYVASMFAYVSTLEDAIKHPKASTLERALTALTAQAVEMQIPYVKEGLVETDPIQTLATRTSDFQQGSW